MRMRDQLLAAVRDGESISAATRRLGIHRQTVYGWRRRDLEFREALSAALAANRTAQLAILTPDPDSPLPDRTELLRRLDQQSRNGSTRATELLLREGAREDRPDTTDDAIWHRLMAVPDPEGAS